MRKYELVCILDPQIVDSNFDEVIEKYSQYLAARKAEVVNIDRWGMRQLAYTSPNLKKRRQGFYLLYQFVAPPELIAPLENDLKIDESVLRYLVVSIDGDFLRIPELAPESILAPRPPYGGRDRGERSDRGSRPFRDRERRREDDDAAREPVVNAEEIEETEEEIEEE